MITAILPINSEIANYLYYALLKGHKSYKSAPFTVRAVIRNLRTTQYISKT